MRLSLLPLLSLFCCASAYEWTAEDERWLDGALPLSAEGMAKEHGVPLSPSGLFGQYNSYITDYDAQDAMLEKLGIPWMRRQAMKWANPTFTFRSRSLTSKQIDAKNGNVKPRRVEDAQTVNKKVPVVEVKVQALHITRLTEARLDGQEFGLLDEQVGVEWSVRAKALADGRLMIIRANDDKGVIREMRAPFAKDPKDSVSGPVVLFEAHLHPADGADEIVNQMWLERAGDAEGSDDEASLGGGLRGKVVVQ